MSIGTCVHRALVAWLIHRLCRRALAEAQNQISFNQSMEQQQQSAAPVPGPLSPTVTAGQKKPPPADLKPVVEALTNQLRMKQADNYRLWKQLSDSQAKVEELQEKLNLALRQVQPEVGSNALPVNNVRVDEVRQNALSALQHVEDLIEQAISEHQQQKEEALELADAVQKQIQALQQRDDSQRQALLDRINRLGQK